MVREIIHNPIKYIVWKVKGRYFFEEGAMAKGVVDM